MDDGRRDHAAGQRRTAALYARVVAMFEPWLVARPFFAYFLWAQQRKYEKTC